MPTRTKTVPAARSKPAATASPKRKAARRAPGSETAPTPAAALAPPTPAFPPQEGVPALCDELKALQRQCVILKKSRIMQENRLVAVVAGTLGYDSKMDKSQGRAVFDRAKVLVKAVAKGEAEHELSAVIRTTMIGVSAFDALQDATEKSMAKIAARLPAAGWVAHPEQRGFGILSLAQLVGEAGDLCSYANPARLWKRMGCAPITSEGLGLTLMGSTWRSARQGTLHAEEWAAFGYSPRRRSVSYVFGENLVKQNQAGPYRTRYLEAKAAAYHSHPEWEWKDCDACDGTGAKEGAACGTCGGTGRKCKRAHLHGMLLATKRLYKRLWAVWNRVTLDNP